MNLYWFAEVRFLVHLGDLETGCVDHSAKGKLLVLPRHPEEEMFLRLKGYEESMVERYHLRVLHIVKWDSIPLTDRPLPGWDVHLLIPHHHRNNLARKGIFHNPDHLHPKKCSVQVIPPQNRLLVYLRSLFQGQVKEIEVILNHLLLDVRCLLRWPFCLQPDVNSKYRLHIRNLHLLHLVPLPQNATDSPPLQVLQFRKLASLWWADNHLLQLLCAKGNPGNFPTLQTGKILHFSLQRNDQGPRVCQQVVRPLPLRQGEKNHNLHFPRSYGMIQTQISSQILLLKSPKIWERKANIKPC